MIMALIDAVQMRLTMRGILLLFVILTFGVTFLMAEPLVLEQAGNVLQPGTLEAGLSEFTYQIGSSKLTDAAGSVTDKQTNTAFIFPFYARYAFSPAIEAALDVPYFSVSKKDEPAGGTTQIFSDSGLADPTLTGKYSFGYNGWDIAAGAALGVPGGKQSATLPSAFRQGFNVKPLIAARKAYGTTTLNVNVSYNLTGEYTDENNIKQDPGDVLSAGIGAEIATPDIDMIAEFIFNNIFESSAAGVSAANSAGSQMDFVFGWRYNTGNTKTKFGVDVALGDQYYRTYDYRVLCAATYLWKI